MKFPSRPLSTWTFALLTFGLLVLAYFPQLSGDFIGDDIGRIEIFSRDVSVFDFWNSGIGDRPILGLSLWLDYGLLGLSPGMMRLESLFFLTILVLLMRRILQDLSIVSADNFWWVDSCLLVFCLHPLHTQTVGHLVQRGILLSAIGTLYATRLLIQCKFDYRTLAWKVALLSWLCALLAKPNMVFMPIVWYLLAGYLEVPKRLPTLLPFCLFLLVPVVFYKVGEFNIQDSGDTLAGPFHYFLGQGRVLILYLRLLLVPVGLKFNHDVTILDTEPLLPGLAVWFFVISGVLIGWRTISNRLVAILLVSILLSLIPESSFFPIKHAAFEHRTFIPIMFMFLALAAVKPPKFRKELLLGCVFILSVVYCTLIHHRTTQVRSLVNWARAEIRNSCQTSFLQFYMLSVLIQKNHTQDALESMADLHACDPSEFVENLARALTDFAASPTFAEAKFKHLMTLTNSDVPLVGRVRDIISSAVLVNLTRKLTRDEAACRFEEFYSNQLRFYHSQQHNHRRSISVYAREATSCLAFIKDSIEPAAIFQRLKIRFIKFKYFGIDDNSLKEDLEIAPKTDDFNYLRESYAQEAARRTR